MKRQSEGSPSRCAKFTILALIIALFSWPWPARTIRSQTLTLRERPFVEMSKLSGYSGLEIVLTDQFALAENAADARAQIEEALTVVGLEPEETLGRYPHQLSGGQRQRLMTARAFLLKPRIIVADEPVSMVDASRRARILRIMMRLKEEYGISFLYITHDLSTAYQIADDIVILYQGAIVEEGNAQEVINHPQHIYTQLLIESIPVPDPDVRWEGPLTLPAELKPSSDV